MPTTAVEARPIFPAVVVVKIASGIKVIEPVKPVTGRLMVAIAVVPVTWKMGPVGEIVVALATFAPTPVWT